MAARTTEGCWEGELSASPFSTAVAAIALRSVELSRPGFGTMKLRTKMMGGLDWLVANANPDGGWGDIPKNATTLLPTLCGWAALSEASKTEKSFRPAAEAAQQWLKSNVAGDLSVSTLAAALLKHVEEPVLVSSVLVLCAVSGCFGEDTAAWKAIPALPFEKAAFPRSWFPGARLTSLDSALPALIAAGQLLHFRSPTGNPILRPIRGAAVNRTLKLLEKMQLENAGIAESVPLTSIVLAAMAASGRISHPISKPCVEFLLRSQYPKGSWALAANTPVTVTAAALDALVAPGFRFRADDAQAWLLEQQFQVSHPISKASPGGWGWTNAPGGIPNSRDTAAALLALCRIRPVIAVTRSEQRYTAVTAGMAWLFETQNSDGGMPTFSQGIDKTPCGGGCPELTAGALRAWLAWRGEVPSLRSKIDLALTNAIAFLKKSQQADGSWKSLWAPRGTCGTSRVLIALAACAVDPAKKSSLGETMTRGTKWLLESQLAAGGWSAQSGGPASVENTAWAIQALNAVAAVESTDSIKQSIERGAEWLSSEVERGQVQEPGASRLFYSTAQYAERLSPLISVTAALGRES